MKVKLIIISIVLLLVIVFASGCIPIMEKLGLVSPTDEEQLTPEKGGPPDGLVKVLIGFKEKPGAAQQALVKGVGGKIKYTYHIVDAIAASIPEASIAGLKANPNVTYLEMDGLVYALGTELGNSWGVDRIDAEVVHAFGGENMGTEVKVAIIDTGIDYTHDDLKANYIGGYDFVNKDDDPMDDHGHGTWCAGIVAAVSNNTGVIGVAPMAHLYAVKVLNSSASGYTSDVVAGIEWSIDHEMQVVSMSLGSDRSSDALKAACDDAYSAGIVLVAAAGNDGNPPGKGDNVDYPAAYDSVIAVAATDKNDKRASWSSTGPAVELAAPGVDIESTWLNGYHTGSGTSAACPHVAGTAALVIASSISGVEQIRSCLTNSAENIYLSNTQQGSGLVDAENAVLDTTDGDNLPPPAAGTIAGNVTDADTTSAIGGATVVVEVTNLSADTDNDGNYVINNVAEGTYTVTASADGYENASQENVTVSADVITSDVDFALYPLSSTGTMHVNDIAMDLEIVVRGKNTFTNAFAVVTIVDVDSNLVEGATVFGHWSGATSDTDSGITDSTGQVSLKSDKVKNPTSGVTTFTFTVDDVTKDGWTYVLSENEEVSGSITFTE